MTRIQEVLGAIVDESEEIDETAEFVRPKPPREAAQVYSLRIPADQLDRVRAAAERHGAAPSALMRRWVLDRLEDEERNASRPTFCGRTSDGVVDHVRLRQIGAGQVVLA